MERHDQSLRWMESNYYSEWEQVLKAYRCERDPEKNEKGEDDPRLVSVGTPLTTGYVNRLTDRVTAQPPNIRFRGKDQQIAELVSRTLMYQWDRTDMQRQQKKHVRQAGLFGWSVRAWWYEKNEYVRRKRVDPFDEAEATMKAIDLSYGDKIEAEFGQPFIQMEPELRANALVWVSSKFGRGKLLDTAYLYREYEGPRSAVIPIADVFPEPNFENFQEQNWFQIYRRRNRNWLKRLADMYPALKDGFNELVRKYPKGTPISYQGGTGTVQSFRARMGKAFSGGNRFNEESDGTNDTYTWTIYEEHVPSAEDPKLRFVGEDDVWIGEIPYPYELEGQIAFTDLVFIDDMIGGIGESLPRFFRGLQELFDRHTNIRWQLLNNILRPLVGTSDLELWEDPGKIKRGNGMRLVYMRRGPNSMWVQGEQAAIAAAAAGANDNREMMALYQLITGDSAASMVAPPTGSKTPTATGVRAESYQQDIITNGLNQMFVQTSLRKDARMMYLINRSELTEAVEFEPSRYNRNYAPGEDPLKQEWAQAEPVHFQMDGEIVVVAGSTIADDDDARSQRALQVWGAASARPDLFNQQKARDEYLKGMGFGSELNEWAAPPPPPPPPPEPEPLKGSCSIKFETLGVTIDPMTNMPVQMPLSPVQQQILKKMGIDLAQQPEMPTQPPVQGAPPVDGPPPPQGMPPGPIPPIPEMGGMPPPGEGAYMASIGRA